MLKTEEYRDILRHLIKTLHELTGPELDEIVRRNFQFTNEAKRDLVIYLKRLIDVLHERSESGYMFTLRSLNENIKVKGGGKIQGVRVELSPYEQELYKREYVDLSLGKDFTEIIYSLKDLLYSIDINNNNVKD